MRPVLRHKLRIVLAITILLVAFIVMAAAAIGAPIDVALVTGALGGFAIASFEEFYVQGRAGIWMRTMRPVFSIAIYSAVLCIIFFVVQQVAHYATGREAQLVDAYRRLPVTIPLLFVIGFFGVLSLRIVGFIGGRNLFNLLIGRYLRPIIETKVFLFLDMKDSTLAVEKLGQIGAKAFIGKFLFDISRPITEHRGEIYLYTGDGLIGMWDWRNALADDNIVAAVDAIFNAVERERDAYLREFGQVPEFRIGVHGGDVAISEQGDTKRAIGVYGATINIAARMEQTAKNLGVGCVFSAAVVNQLSDSATGFGTAGEAKVKGISGPVRIMTYTPGERLDR